MTANGWFQIALFSVVVLGLTKPLGAYMYRVFEGDRQPLPRVLGRLERFLYRLSGVDPAREQGWKAYAASMLVFSACTMLVTYGLQRLQHVLPLNPQRFAAVPPDLAFNTAARCCGFSGRTCCRRSIAYVTSIVAAAKTSIEAA